MPSTNPWSDVPVAPAGLDVAALAAGREVELDVGFGRGAFLLGRAAARPDALLLGLETRRKWVGLARRRAAARGLGNVEPWFGDARAVLGTWGPPGAFAAIFVNFPDPWWKKRHQKRLVVEAEAVGVMARLLRPGGALFVQTDVAERAAAYRAVLEAEPRLHEARGRGEGADGSNPFGVASHREGKCLEAGLPVFRLLFERGL